MGRGSAGWPGPVGSLPPDQLPRWFPIPSQPWDEAWGLQSHSLGSRTGEKGLLKKHQVHLEGVEVSGLRPMEDQGRTPSPWSSLGLGWLA